MNKRITWLLIIYCLFLGCSVNKKANELKQIFVEKGINTPEELLLSDVAKSVSYIALQTDTSCLVSAYDRFHLTNDFIIVFGERCLLFNREGKFLRGIGRQGKGPGEYISASRGFVNNNEIYIPSTNLQIYDLNGDFLKSVQRVYNYLWIYPIGNNRFLGYRSYLESNQEWCFSIFSDKEESITTLPVYDHLSANNGNQSYDECVIAHDGDKVIFRELYNDTIFAITPDKKVNTAYILNTGKYMLPRSTKVGWTRKNMQKKIEEYSTNYFRTNAIFLTASLIFVTYIFQNQNQVGYFPRKGGNFYTSIKMNEDGCFINDLDGGANFYPVFGNENSNELADVFWPFEVFQIIKENPDSEFAKNFKNDFTSLNENDNPVVMIAKLKE